MGRHRTVRRCSPIPTSPALAGCLMLLMIASAGARAAEPDRPARRYIPAQGLVAYLEYDGLDAHAAAWRATAAHDLLYRTPAGRMLVELFRQMADGAIKEETEGQVDAADVLALGDLIVRKGFAYGIYDHGGDEFDGVLVLKAMGQSDLGRRLGLADLMDPPARIRGRDLYPFYDESDDELERNPLYIDEPPGTRGLPLGPRIGWAWMEGDDLIIAGTMPDRPAKGPKKTAAPGPGADFAAQVLDTIEGKAPTVETLAAFRAAAGEGKDLKGFEPDGLFFVDVKPELDGPVWLMMAAMAPIEIGQAMAEGTLISHLVADEDDALDPAKDDEMRLVARRLGFDQVKRVVGRWGFQGKALLSDVRFESAPPRKGVPGLFDQPSFRTDRLPVIPPDATDFVLASFEPERFGRKVVEIIRGFEPEAGAEIDRLDQGLRAMFGLRVGDDLLRHIGPSWAIVNVPDQNKKAGTAARKHSVLVASLDEAGAIETLINTMLWEIDLTLRGYAAGERARAPQGREIGAFGMRKLPAPDRGYRVDFPAFEFNADGPEPLVLDPDAKAMRSLFLVLGRSSMAVASDLDAARRIVADGAKPARPWKPSGELASALEGLPRDLTFLSVTDPALCSLPDTIAGLPDTIRSLLTFETLSADVRDGTGWGVLNLLGLPRPGQPWPRIDRAHTPRVEDLRRSVFASVLATAVDDRGYRVIHRQPLPFAGLASEIAYHQRWSITWKSSEKPRIKYRVGVVLPRFSSSGG